MMVLQRIAKLAPTGLMMVAAGMACGQNYPEKSIRLLTPPAGGSTEFTSRLLADAVAGSLGQRLIIEGRPGQVSAEIAAQGTAYRGAGSTCLETWMRPGSGPQRAGHDRGLLRAYTVASPSLGPLLLVPARRPTATPLCTSPTSSG